MSNKMNKPIHPLFFNKFKKSTMLLLVFAAFVFIAATVVFAKEKIVVVEATILNVRTGPGLSYDVMTQVVEKDQLKVLDEKNEWYKVRLADDKIGWVASWLVKNTEVASSPTYIGVISGPEVNIRKEANTDSDILGTVTKGTELTVLFKQNNWVQVDYYGQVAWISEELITITNASPASQATASASDKSDKKSIKQVSIKTNGTNIRSGPSTSETILLKANKGDTFDFVKAEGDWYLISLENGNSGYVANWTVDLSDPDALTTSIVRATSLAEATIVIDAGHGGKDPGAVTDQLIEKDLTIQTAKLLAQKLQSFGTNVIMTRNGDEFVSLNDRVYAAHEVNADAFISIHYDAIEAADSVSGTSTYYYSETDRQLAEQLNSFLSSVGPLKNNGVKKGDYLVLRENRQPSILLELGYVNSSVDSKVIQTEAYRSIVTDHIVQALLEFYTN